MPDNISSMIILWLFAGVGMLALFRLLMKAFRNRFAPVRKVKATVVDKNTVEFFSKYAGNGKSEKYVIVFSVDGKKKSFYVSQFSYNGYRIGEKGMLTYKGDKLIGFQ